MGNPQLEHPFLWDLSETELSEFYATASLKYYATATPKLERKKWADGYPVNVHTLFKSFKIKRLVSGTGDKVPISALEGKDIGLYFYSYLTPNCVFNYLEYMYDELRKQGKNFELVFICLRDRHIREGHTEDTFSKFFEGRTWLASPFLQWKSNNKLFSEFCLRSDPYYGAKLVIIQQNDVIAHTYALDIFIQYGVDAYPFSKSRLTELEVVRFKSLKLDSLCFPKAYFFRWGSDGQQIQVPLDQLMGKNIIFFLTTYPDDYSDGGGRDNLIHQKVSEWYIEMKQKVPEFEMVRLVYNYNESFRKVCESCKGKMPWLEFPCNKYEMKAMYEQVFHSAGYLSKDFLPVFVAFGQDGKFRSMTSLGRFVDDGKIVDNYAMFFEDGHLYGEVRDYIARCNSWSTVNEETGVCYIPV